MTASGRKLPFVGIAKAFNNVIATKGWSRPFSVIHAGQRERQLLDCKADIACEEIIMRRSNRSDCPHSQALAVVGWAAPTSRFVVVVKPTSSLRLISYSFFPLDDDIGRPTIPGPDYDILDGLAAGLFFRLEGVKGRVGVHDDPGMP